MFFFQDTIAVPVNCYFYAARPNDMNPTKIQIWLWRALLVALTLSCTSKPTSVSVEPDRKSISTIAFGSCNKQWESQAHWQQIARFHPDLWIWMGDIIYSDTEDMDQLAFQYEFLKNNQAYKIFADSVQVIGIWDDHDYGVNDGDRNYPKRKESRDLLYRFLDIPEKDPAWNREGAYRSYRFGPSGQRIAVFLLDGRFFRDPLFPDSVTNQRYLPNVDGTYLGEEQWNWLATEWENSDADIHFIVSGIQVLPTEHPYEKWANFPKERERLLHLVKSSGIRNPVFLSGDRHIGEISVVESDSTYSWIEITSSGLTHSFEEAVEANPYRRGPLITVKNFGLVQIDWESRNMEVSISQLNGKSVSQISLPLHR